MNAPSQTAPRFPSCSTGCFQHFSSTVLALLEADGRVVEANRGFWRLLERFPPKTGNPVNAAGLFVQPLFTEFAACPPAPGQPLYTGLIHIGDMARCCVTLNGEIHKVGPHLLVLAEFDLAQMEMLNAQVTHLNEELAKTQRSLARINRQLQASEARFKALSITDPLTALANRRHLEERLIAERVRSLRHGDPFSLVMVDIDHFKQINDRHGHGVGDEVLRQFAGLLRAQVRGSDLPARFGGEEFVLVLPATELLAAKELAERLRTTVRATGFPPLPNGITASFGVAQHRQGDSLHSLLKRVDAALYKAKSAGRDRIVVAGP